jgi:hypothetical protein
MQEGLTVNLVISGATLVTVVSVAVRIWLSTRPQKIEQPVKVEASQPVELKEAPASFNSTLCRERHQILSGQVADLYAKINDAREGQAEIRGTLQGMKDQMNSIDGKMDKLIGLKEGEKK